MQKNSAKREVSKPSILLLEAKMTESVEEGEGTVAYSNLGRAISCQFAEMSAKEMRQNNPQWAVALVSLCHTYLRMRDK